MIFKPKTCKWCAEKFMPVKPLQSVCCIDCAIKLQRKNAELRREKEARKETAAAKEKIMTHKDWLNLLQIVFNTFIRERDKGKPCISCGTKKDIQYQAGHYYSVGGNPSVRFNEDNVHSQCSTCNNHLHGNLIAYTERLPLRIGAERFEALKQARNTELKLSIPEIKLLITKYRIKTKLLKTLANETTF